MAQTQDALFHKGLQFRMDHTPVADVAGGALLFFGSGVEVLVAVACDPIAAAAAGSLVIFGIFKIKKKAAETFSVGDLVGWDETPGEAVPGGDAGLTQQLGCCVGQDAASGDDYVLTAINFSRGWEASA